MFWKTWESEAALSGAKRTEGGSVANLWEFTIEDDTVRKQIEELPPGTPARIHYKQVWFGLPWNGETDYRATKVEAINSDTSPTKPSPPDFEKPTGPKKLN